MVVCLEQGADLHMAQLMPLPLTVTCFSKVQIGLTFLIPAHLGSPGKRAVKQVCVCSAPKQKTPNAQQNVQSSTYIILDSTQVLQVRLVACECNYNIGTCLLLQF